MLDVIRRRGFVVEEFRPAPQEFGEILSSRLASEIGWERANRLLVEQPRLLADYNLLGELDAGQSYWPISVNAPVFNSDGEVALAMCVVDSPGPMLGTQVIALGHTVAEMADQATLVAHGRRPLPASPRISE